MILDQSGHPIKIEIKITIKTGIERRSTRREWKAERTFVQSNIVKKDQNYTRTEKLIHTDLAEAHFIGQTAAFQNASLFL